MVKKIPFGDSTLYAIDGEFLLDGKEYYCKDGYLFTASKCKNDEAIRRAIEYYGTENLTSIHPTFVFNENGELDCCFAKIKTLTTISDVFLDPPSNANMPTYVTLSACIGRFTSLETLEIRNSIVYFIHNNFKKLPNLREVMIAFGGDVIPSALTEADISYALQISAPYAGSFESEFKCYRIARLLIAADTQQVHHSIGNLTNLEALAIYNDVATTIPSSIRNCRKLTHLSIGMDNLVQIPSWLAYLENLSYISIQSDKITQIADPICNIRSLKNIELYFCGSLTSIPDCIGKLSALEQLNVLFCRKITQVPETIGDLRSLRVLAIAGCNIDRLPESLGALSKLELLSLYTSSISSLPDSIGGLESIKLVNLAYTKISVLPESFFSLKTLKFLDIQGTKMSPEYVNYIKERMPWVSVSY